MKELRRLGRRWAHLLESASMLATDMALCTNWRRWRKLAAAGTLVETETEVAVQSWKARAVAQSIAQWRKELSEWKIRQQSYAEAVIIRMCVCLIRWRNITQRHRLGSELRIRLALMEIQISGARKRTLRRQYFNIWRQQWCAYLEMMETNRVKQLLVARCIQWQL